MAEAATSHSSSDSAAAATSPVTVTATSTASLAFGRRFVWGSNGSGVLGLGHTDDLFTPTMAPLVREQRRAAVGAATATDAAVTESDAVTAAAAPTSAIPTLLSTIIRFTRMSCGGCHTLAVDEIGRVWSWGDNSRGQLGQDEGASAASAPAVQSSPALIPSLTDRRCSWVSAGWSHSACVLAPLAASDDAGSCSVLFTFGCNSRSQLGLGSTSKQLPMLATPTEVVAQRDQGVTQVECGGRHTLVLTDAGRVFAFGDNAHGQLGVGDFESKANPTLVKATATAEAAEGEPLLCSTICAGWRHSLFVCVDRKSIYAAGSNNLGELGVGAAASSASSSSSTRASSKFSRPVPVRLPAAFTEASSTVRSISCGWSHNIVLSSSAQLFGWGRANFGALATKPTGADAGSGAGSGDGDGDGEGEAGGGSKGSKSVALPVEISLPASIDPQSLIDVACGSEHTVLLTVSDVLVCGWNEHGNLGLGHNREMNDEDTFAFTAIPQLHSDELISRRIVTGGAAVMVLEP